MATRNADRRYSVMRVVILILIVIILVLLAGVATGYLDINQIRGAKAPQVSATGNGIQARGGQAPAFDIETGSVEVGTRNATVKLPDVRLVPADSRAATTNATANRN